MARLEYKYYIPLSALDELRRDILPFLKFDSFSLSMPKKEYTVRSIYLDSARFQTYNEKLDGLFIRNKYRIRGYNQPTDKSIIFAEIKRKEKDFVSKDRIPLLYNNLNEFISKKDFSLIYSPAHDRIHKEASARNFFYYYSLLGLLPAAVITYDREAFECKFGSGLRVTFDKNIRAVKADSFNNLFEEGTIIPPFDNFFVLEIKFYKIVPGWLPIIMSRYDIFRESVSKYAFGIDTVYKSNYLNYLN